MGALQRALFAAIFFSGGLAAAQVAFGLVLVENDPRLSIQTAVDMLQSFRQIFMYGCR